MNWEVIINGAMTQAFGPTMVIYALAAIGLNVHFGYTGLLNFGQAAFAAIASYGLAVTVASFGLPFWLGLGVGLLGGALLAVLLGIPTLRLRADYLAIVTIAASEIVRRLFRSVTFSKWTGGSDGKGGFGQTFIGMNPYPEGYRFDVGPFFFSRHDMWVMTVGYVLISLAVLVVWLAMRSPWGRVLKAIREDEDAVRSLGKNVFSYKMQSLLLGGLIGALAGFMFALSRLNVQPDNYSTDFTFYLYAMVILGGAARIFGPLVGAILFWFLFNFVSNLLREVDRLNYLPDSILTATRVGPVVFGMLGLGIVLLLIFRPQGIFGDKREISLDVR